MNTLTINDIFYNLKFYQQNYQAILSNPEQYQTIVKDAEISVWPLAAKPLYLGDLLQLWFSQKWLINKNFNFQPYKFIKDFLKPPCESHDLYLYQIEGNALLGKGIAKVWSVTDQCTYEVIVESSLQYYSTYRSVLSAKGRLRESCT